MVKVNLLTDAPKHNLALMKISAWHKAIGDEVTLNEPMAPCDVSYGSWLFQQRFHTDHAGGPAVDPAIRLDGQFDQMKPDYNLFPMDYSIGFTWEYCPRQCGWCCVPKQQPPKAHHSIWTFHDPRFSKICLLNNNTFSDPQWRETFEEIWEADLIVIDENGYDLRLMDGEKAAALQRTKFQGYLHFAWDVVEDEDRILEGLRAIKEAGINRKRVMVYTLIGYPDGRAIEHGDIYRCQLLSDKGFDPYVMIYNNSRNRQLRQFRRLVNRSRAWRRSLELEWARYRP